MTSPATPVPAAAEQQHQKNDNKDQFHGKPPPRLYLGERTACRELSSVSPARTLRSALPEIFARKFARRIQQVHRAPTSSRRVAGLIRRQIVVVAQGVLDIERRARRRVGIGRARRQHAH